MRIYYTLFSTKNQTFTEIAGAVFVGLQMIFRTKVQEIVESSLGRAPVERAHGKVIAFAKNEASYLVLHFT